MNLPVFARIFAVLCLGYAVTADKIKILSIDGEDKAMHDEQKISGVKSLIDGDLKEEDSVCYTSKTKDGWVEAKFQFAEVKHVRFVPGSSDDNGDTVDYYYYGDGGTWPAEKAVVHVCTGGSQCKKCNVAQKDGTGEWASSECPPGTQGDSVKITQQGAENLQLCEIEVKGKGLVGQIHVDEISGTTRREPDTNHFADIQTLVNGETKESTSMYCYQAGEHEEPWVKAEIPNSKVTEIRIFPYWFYPWPEHVQKVENFIFEVCTGDSNCVKCGSAPNTDNDKWTSSKCPDNTKGDTVKFTINKKTGQDNLRFCEMQIMGIVLP